MVCVCWGQASLKAHPLRGGGEWTGGFACTGCAAIHGMPTRSSDSGLSLTQTIEAGAR